MDRFAAAAREMGVSQPTVSKQVADLESHLGARLLNRSTRSVSVDLVMSDRFFDLVEAGTIR